jgi:RNA polymerase sigma-70 factor (ECF subfamily)
VLYAGLVYYWCRSAGLSPEDAEDVGQQVFLSVSRGIASFRRDRPDDSFRGWLRVITRSRIADHFRNNSVREIAFGGEQRLTDSVASPMSDSDCIEQRAREDTILFDQALKLMRNEFSEKDCQAFLQVVIEGLSVAEVAGQLGVSANTIYIAKSRILKRLRSEFGDLLDE